MRVEKRKYYVQIIKRQNGFEQFLEENEHDILCVISKTLVLENRVSDFLLESFKID